MITALADRRPSTNSMPHHSRLVVQPEHQSGLVVLLPVGALDRMRATKSPLTRSSAKVPCVAHEPVMLLREKSVSGAVVSRSVSRPPTRQAVRSASARRNVSPADTPRRRRLRRIVLGQRLIAASALAWREQPDRHARLGCGQCLLIASAPQSNNANVEQARELFHEHAAFRSPVLFKPYEGRDQVLKILRAADLSIGEQRQLPLRASTRRRGRSRRDLGVLDRDRREADRRGDRQAHLRRRRADRRAQSDDPPGLGSATRRGGGWPRSSQGSAWASPS